MGMTANYKSISPQVLALLRTNPDIVESFLVAVQTDDPGMSEAFCAKMEPMLKNQADEMRAYLVDDLEIFSTPDQQLILNSLDQPGISLDKTFRELQFHIAGEVSDSGRSVASRSVSGGEQFGPDLGYGPAKFLTVAETADCSAALDRISDTDFLTRYRSDKWDAGVTRFCLGYFQALRAYYKQAAQAGFAMLVWGA